MSIERSELGANIRNYIELNKALEIDGVGNLIKTSKHCSLSSNAHFLFPGEECITLAQSEGNKSSDFVLYLAEQLDISFAEAFTQFEEFCGTLQHKLEHLGRYYVSGLGQFINNNGIVSFETYQKSLTGNFYGLPALNLKAITVPTAQKAPTKSGRSEPVRSKSDHSDRRFLINAATVAALFLMLVFVHHSWIQDEQPDLTHLQINQHRLNQDPEKVLVGEPISPELIPGKIEKEEEVATCALIIGSFARRANAIEMQQKVIQAGYQLYTEEFHEFYRVGVAIDCSELKGASFKDVESTLGVDPWLRIAR